MRRRLHFINSRFSCCFRHSLLILLNISIQVCFHLAREFLEVVLFPPITFLRRIILHFPWLWILPDSICMFLISILTIRKLLQNARVHADLLILSDHGFRLHMMWLIRHLRLR